MEKLTLYLVDVKDKSLSELLPILDLNEDELGRVYKYKVDRARKEEAVSIYLKRKYIGEYSLNEYGKPISNKTHFNISHSNGVIGLAISPNKEVGLDIEMVKQEKEGIASYVNSSEELKNIKDSLDFFRSWTSKESLLKCLATGIKGDLKEVPAFPLNGKKTYAGVAYFSKNMTKEDYVISLTLLGEEDFEIDLINIYL